ncbi:TetR/AcrR family transcriptional regulator [Nocardia takedensis]
MPERKSAAVAPRDETPANARTDARRNRALVLTAAQRAFAQSGTSVSLAEIARRAGVGAGTVHRHFPTKIALLEAVLEQRVDGLTATALRFRGAPDAGAALLEFCALLVVRTPGNKALCDMLEADDGWPRTLVRDAGERFERALAALLVAGQREGSIRPDLTVPDLLALFVGCVAIQRATGGGQTLSHPARVVLEALREPCSEQIATTANPARTTASLVGQPLRDAATGQVFAADRRNGTRPSDETGRAELAEQRCPICAAELRRSPTGRPARYCSPACRQKAHRRRLAAPDRFT